MARVVVVGAGLGGLAVALRLAKQGQDVTLLERGAEPGGALRPVRAGGFSWDGAATWTLLPAVLRDLARKTGRPLERELDLEPLAVLREHRFADDTRLLLPGGSRQAQRRAFDELGPGLGEQWLAHTDAYAPTWEKLRRGYLEPWGTTSSGTPSPDARAVLNSRETLRRRVRRALPDDRLADVATHPVLVDGHAPRHVPAWVGVGSWLEQCFGGWRFDGGTARLLELLVGRLTLRGVALHTATETLDVVVRAGRCVGVATAAGVVEADVVVCAVDPRRLPSLAPLVRSTTPAAPPPLTHVGLADAPPLGHELVMHGDPLVVVRPSGPSAWTVLSRGRRAAQDPLDDLARRGLDVRATVVTRVDRTRSELVEDWGGSPLGVLWQGRGTTRRRLGPRTPVPGLYAAGAHAAPGSGLPFVGLSAALVVHAVLADLGHPVGG